MKYIKTDTNGFISYDSYFSYLKSVRDNLGEDLFSFASNPSRHDLRSEGSLHDAWVESLSIKSFYEESQRDLTSADVKLVLLGQKHDRMHTLSYFNVKACRIDFDFCKNARKRDLLHHELRYENGFMEHEFVFDGDMTIEIICVNLKHDEQLLP